MCTPDRNDRNLEKVTFLLATILDWVEAGPSSMCYSYYFINVLKRRYGYASMEMSNLKVFELAPSPQNYNFLTTVKFADAATFNFYGYIKKHSRKNIYSSLLMKVKWG